MEQDLLVDPDCQSLLQRIISSLAVARTSMLLPVLRVEERNAVYLVLPKIRFQIHGATVVEL